MIHPNTRLKFISEDIGYGVVATKFIPKGTITWVHDKLDRIFTPQEIKSFEPIYQDILSTYSFRNNKGNYIFCWDNGRYVNHSFNSNCLSTGYDFEIAIRDIFEGEELTDDYGYLNIIEAFEPSPEESERKIVYPDDLKKYHKEWDAKLIANFPYIFQNEQALLPLLKPETVQEIKEVVAGLKDMKSILNLLFENK